MSLSSAALANSVPLKTLMQKPLILVASVSGGYLTKSPGKIAEVLEKTRS